MSDRPPRPPRTETREVVELRQLRLEQPELSSAIDMQLELVEAQRRVQSRVPLPWIQPDPAWVIAQQRAARPVVRFADIPLEWTDFRLTLRQTADILHRYEVLDQGEHRQILLLSRDGNALQPLVSQWYAATSGVDGTDSPQGAPAEAPANIDQVLVLSMRPFLAKCAESLAQRADLSGWRHSHCPYCGWEPISR